MAAPPAPTVQDMLKGKQAGKKIIKAAKQKKTTRNVLLTPYVIEWPPVHGKTSKEVTAKLVEAFSQHDLKRNRKDNNEADTRVKSPESASLRAQLKTGINEVTRALEQDKLRLVLIDRSIDSKLTTHLLPLASSRQCPIIGCWQLTKSIGPLLGITSLTTFGFLKNPQGPPVFDDLVKYISTRCNMPHIPWLQKEAPELGSRARKKQSPGEAEKRLKTKNKNRGQSSSKGPEAKPLPPIDFSSIYVKKTDSKLVDGKVDTEGFGKSGFIAFGDDSSDENEIKVSGSYQKKKKSQTQGQHKDLTPGSKRKHQSLSYVSPSIGRMQGNKDRIGGTSKKKRVS